MQPQNPYPPQPGQPTPQPGQPGPVPPYPANGYAPEPQGYGTPPVSYTSQQPAPVTTVNQYPVDYLNQIAAPTHVKKMNPFVLFGLLGALLLAVGIALVVMVQAAAPPSVSSQLYAAQARLDTIVKVTSEQGSHLTQNKLSSINSTLGATTKSMQANLTSYMTTRGLKSAAAKAAATKTETAYYNDVSQRLNDSYLTGTLDRTYPSELTYQLTILKSKLQKIKVAANSKAFNAFYDQNVPTLDTMVKQLSAFQSTE